MSMLEIKDAVAVITGGSGGIGKALARYWLENQGRVVLADMAETGLEAARRELEGLGGEVATFRCDVTSEVDSGNLADYAIERFGAINLVAPFAGIIQDALLVNTDRETGMVTGKMSLSAFQKVLDVNVTGVFLTVRECVERMINNKCKGLVCLVSSVNSLGAAGQLNYSSSKAAMAVMPKVLTAEFFRRGIADRIRCVAIAPGFVGTPMVASMNQNALSKILDQVPLGRLIEPREVSSLVGELFRNEAMAGDVYYIHGGLRIGSRG
ncbi:MAG: SDR family NAD(P)-dependent oxidoreductase [Deferrisomatales bacterium]|nr:SDR family NAD(P)-dependent oxidoreductase [Deferrisomatales bacterium]